jgi:outer membrane protein
MNEPNGIREHGRRAAPLAVGLAAILFFFGAGPPASAQAPPKEPLRLSLQAARDYALEHSFEVRRAGLDTESARQKLKETVASGLPQITSGIGYSNNMILATSLIPNFFDGKPEEKIPVQFGTQHNANANIQVQQLVFNGSYLVGLQTSKVYTGLADTAKELSELNVQEAVTGTYGLILVAGENEKILRATLANVEKTRDEIVELHKEGFVAGTDVDLIQIAVNQLRAGLQTVEKQKGMAVKLLKFQMGLELGTEVALTDTLEDLLASVDVERALEARFDPERSTELELAGFQERLAEKAMKNQRASSWPSVSAFFTFQQNAYRDRFNFLSSGQRWFPLSILGVNVNVPLFRSGLQKARTTQAELALEQAREARDQAARGLELEVERTKVRLSTAWENYRNMKDNMDLAARVHDATLEKYREGLASSLELTQAHDKFLQAESSYIQALSELLSAKNRLDRVTNSHPLTNEEG